MVANLAATPAQGGEDGPLNGQGTFKAANGDEYTGNWVDGKKQGQGTYKHASGDQYTGNWVDGEKQGQGTYTWPDGTRFEGEWQDGKKFSGTQISALAVGFNGSLAVPV